MLKKLISIAVMVLALIINSCSNKSEAPKQTFEYSPAKPKAGEKILIKYNPKETVLNSSEEIEMVAYLVNLKDPVTKGIIMSKKEGYFETEIQTTHTNYAVLIKFNNEDLSVSDNNKNKGYLIELYNNNNEKVKGSRAAVATAYSTWGNWYSDLDYENSVLVKMFEEEFSNNPEQKEKFLFDFLNILYKSDRPDASVVVKSELDKFAQKDKLTENEIESLFSLYNRILEKETAKKFYDMSVKQFPNSRFAQQETYNKFIKLEDIDEKTQILSEFEKTNPESPLLSRMYNSIITFYGNHGDLDGIRDFIIENKEKFSLDIFNRAANIFLVKNSRLDFAEEISMLGIELIRSEIKNSKQKPDPFLSEREISKQNETRLAYLLDTYGQILNTNAKEKEALSSFEEAYSLTKGESLDINANYTSLLVKSGDLKKAQTVFEELMLTGNINEEMKEKVKEVYITLNGSEEGFIDYLKKYQDSAKETLKKELEEKIISQPAPEFVLFDMDGNKVSISDFKGKTVIVDFWATWCGPCISSFPGMQVAVNKYKDDPNVKFLFINTWENVEDKLQNAKDFITKNKYAFHVLMDTQNEVVRKFQVDGIPTKFIIDKNGMIRFKSVGYNGNNDLMVQEIEMMIAMTK